jgi:hypothetical protein
MRQARTLRSAVRSLAEALARHYPVPESSLEAINELLRTEPEFLQVTGTRGRYSVEFKVPVPVLWIRWFRWRKR